YATLPIIASFSVLSDAMLPTFACIVWSLDAFLQILDKPTKRAFVHAFLAYAVGGVFMWEAYFIAPFIAVFALVYQFPRRGRPLRLRPNSKLNALMLHTLVTAAACILVEVFHVFLTRHAGAWKDFLDSYRVRSAPPSAQYVIDRHLLWV